MRAQAVKNLNPLICRFYFLDGKAKAMGVNPSATASDVIRALAEKIELQNVDGWALYEVHRQSCMRGTRAQQIEPKLQLLVISNDKLRHKRILPVFSAI